MIVKLDWDGDLKSNVLLDTYKGRTSFIRCPGGEVHKIATEMKKGKATWNGSYVAF